MNDALLQVSGLSKSFGAVQASRNLSLDIRQGEIHALIGPNGAGKTTAIKQLAGEILPDEGSIVFNGMEIAHLPAQQRARLGLARSFQITSVFEQLSVEENLVLAVQAHQGHSFRFWRPARKDPALQAPTRSALEHCGLEARADMLAGNLSHGEKRQLDVGMALAGNPKLLLLDEPMAGMGPGGTVKLSELILSLKGSVSILLVEHDMDVIFSLADRITVLVYGESIATGTPDEIRGNSDVQRAYLGGVRD
ncbi:MAG: ABC transporter ATP-binding protein [Candidatus Sedimenticola sp. 6PFRAG7]